MKIGVFSSLDTGSGIWNPQKFLQNFNEGNLGSTTLCREEGHKVKTYGQLDKRGCYMYVILMAGLVHLTLLNKVLLAQLQIHQPPSIYNNGDGYIMKHHLS